MSAKDPMLILSITGPDGKVTDSPLFAALPVTAGLCKQLRFLADFARIHRVDSMGVRHRDAPIYWDFPPGSRFEGCMEEYSQWSMTQTAIFLELWGRTHLGDGGFSEVRLLAVATPINVEILETLKADGGEIQYLEDEQTEGMLGQASCGPEYQ